MDWTKIFYDELFLSDKTDKEILDTIKVRSLCAKLEKIPSLNIVQKTIKNKKIDDIFIKNQWDFVENDVKIIQNKRENEKTRYQSQVGIQGNSAARKTTECNRPAPKRREEENKEESLKENNLKERSQKKMFVIPSPVEVSLYMQEIITKENYRLVTNEEVNKFLDHHTASGWMIGKNKAKDWRSMARTWLRNANTWYPKVIEESRYKMWD